MKKIKVILVGESNVGKTSLINLLSKTYFKVSNFAGTTIEKNTALFTHQDFKIEITDLPGVFSIDNDSPNYIETLVHKQLYSFDYDLIINVASTTTLDRNLNLCMDVLELNNKTILCVNMMDEAEDMTLHTSLLGDLLNIDVVNISVKYSRNIDLLLNTIVKVHTQAFKQNNFKYPKIIEDELDHIESFIIKNSNYLTKKSIKMGLKYIGINNDELHYRYIALKVLQGNASILEILSQFQYYRHLCMLVNESKIKINQQYATENFKYLTKELKHDFAYGVFLQSTDNYVLRSNFTNTIDKILLNRYFGIPIFLFIMWLIFQSTFNLGAIPMEYIENGFSHLSLYLSPLIHSSNIHSLLLDGILPGISAVIMFLPNIIILFLGITLLESTGYLTRVSYLLDGFLHKFGLHGKSIVPLIIGFGCTVPAYMATRILESKKDKILTLFILGFISCSAKLPVYVLFISAFFEPSISGSVLFGIYIFGIVIALLSAQFLHKTIFRSNTDSFIMEMPKYRLPSFRLVFMSIWVKSLMYIKKAGLYITLISTLIWFASSFPKYNNKNATTIVHSSQQLEQSYLGSLGKMMTPVFEPIGFDWKMSVSLIAGAAAKEVIVSTLSVLYVVEQSSENTLVKKLKSNIDFASAMSFIVFVALYLPCFAATVVFAKESGNILYLISLIIFTLCMSWLASFLVYNSIKAFA